MYKIYISKIADKLLRQSSETRDETVTWIYFVNAAVEAAHAEIHDRSSNMKISRDNFYLKSRLLPLYPKRELVREIVGR